MTNLKELTWENHKKAERSRFMQRMLKRNLTEYQYYVYLTNQLMSYYILESIATRLGLLDDIQDIKRATKLSKDLSELEVIHGFEIPIVLKATNSYIKYLESISLDPDRILAHIYVRHMGDLSGGQILKKLVPGSALYYQFDSDVDLLKEKLRLKLNDTMAKEANICFEMIFTFLEDLENSFGTLEPTKQSS